MADKKWKKEDNQFLIDHYYKLSAAELAECLGRTKYSITSKLQRMGLSSLCIKKKMWSEVEDEYLKEYSKLFSMQVLSIALSRTERSIRLRLYEICSSSNCYKTWTNNDVDYLVKNYGYLKTNVIAQKMGRTLGSIYFKINELKNKGLVNVF